MKISRDKGHITHTHIPRRDIQQIRLLYGNPKTISQWLADTGADYVVNASLYSGGKPIESFMTDGKVISSSDWCRRGFGINWDGSVQFGDINPNYRDFTCGFPMLIQNSRADINFAVGADLQGKHPRTVFSQTPDGYMITTVDGRQQGKPGMSLPELADYLSNMDILHAANLDGGGSTRIEGKTEGVINSPSENRAVPAVLAIWLKNEDGGNKVSKKIVIDAGHNHSNFDTGAEGNGLREQDITFEIARLAGERLRKSGFDVKLTRNNLTDNLGTNLSASLSTRAKVANDWGADLFLSIHCNAFTDPAANGAECYIYRMGNTANPIAIKINGAIVRELATTDRGVKARPDLAVLKQTAMPAILIETAFISNPLDALKLKTRQGDFAQAIAEAVAEHYGVELTNNTEIPAEGNKYSYDDTVNNMILDGVTTTDNMQHWEKVLDGREPLNREYVRAVLDRYSEKVRGA